MVTQTITGSPIGAAVRHQTKANIVYMQSTIVDFNTQSHTSSDVFEVIEVPVSTMVLAAGIDVLTVDAAGNSGTLALVDSVNSVTFVTAAAPTALGQMTFRNAAGEEWNYYTTTDSLDLTVATGKLDGKVRVWAVMLDMLDPITAQRVVFS